MELDKKCLLEFWNWYLLPEQRRTYKTSSLRGNDSVVKIRFLAMSFTERYGVLVDYFESVNIYIELKLNTEPTMQGSIFKSIRPEILCDGVFKSCLASFSRKPKARIEAIKKANELRNKQLDGL